MWPFDYHTSISAYTRYLGRYLCAHYQGLCAAARSNEVEERLGAEPHLPREAAIEAMGGPDVPVIVPADYAVFPVAVGIEGMDALSHFRESQRRPPIPREEAVARTSMLVWEALEVPQDDALRTTHTVLAELAQYAGLFASLSGRALQERAGQMGRLPGLRVGLFGAARVAVGDLYDAWRAGVRHPPPPQEEELADMARQVRARLDRSADSV